MCLDIFTIEALFSTVTNVNFDPERLLGLFVKAVDLRGRARQLYEDAGSMLVEETSNGPIFRFEIHGSRSEGIKNMQIFCFDIMLMRLCAQRGIGPGFLIHDSHLFDGVDGRQVISALRVGAKTAEELGFQYIVTMNEDDAFKEREKGFDLNDYVLDVKITDAGEDGGLFGIRFD